MPTLAQLGEDRVIAALLARLPEQVRAGKGIVHGAGDDCAVVQPEPGAGFLQLLKSDCVLEGVHYTPETSPGRVGWKALCRPLSDIAAMGGEPQHALITLALPAGYQCAYAEGIYDGLARAAERFGVTIVGGETARSPSAAFISVTLTGRVEVERLVTRSGANPGDFIYVSGSLGGSFASGKHLDFEPRLAQARWLTAHFRPSAMMDLSDGLGRDLPRLAAASGTSFVLDQSRVPVHSGCSIEQALGDGEDYELLFTLPASEDERLTAAWMRQWPGLSLTCVGEICEGNSPLAHAGFDHFSR